MTPAHKAFHDHLDACKQCRDNPFALCLTGAALLKKTTGPDVVEVKEDLNSHQILMDILRRRSS